MPANSTIAHSGDWRGVVLSGDLDGAALTAGLSSGSRAQSSASVRQYPHARHQPRPPGSANGVLQRGQSASAVAGSLGGEGEVVSMSTAPYPNSKRMEYGGVL